MNTGARQKKIEETKAEIRPTLSEQAFVVPVTPDQNRSLALESRRTGAWFRVAWYTGNVLLILAFLVAAYSFVWEYSARKYLKGFSDAVVPAGAAPEEKIQAILNWMSTGPARRGLGPDVSISDRDPTDTLNYASLLRVCGSATNAFVNLADSAGLASRRLLLLDSRRVAKHVVAEVLVSGRWIVVDPAFRTIMQGKGGRLLSKEELRDPAVFAGATSSISGYSSDYTYDSTVHVRLARLGWLRTPLRKTLNRLLPGWEDSTVMTLVMERESLATLVIALFAVFLLALVRVGLRWYGESRLGVSTLRIRQQFRRALHAFMDAEA